MKPVDIHFGTGVTSKHDANLTSSFSEGSDDFSCIDCHDRGGLLSYVAYDGATGDANVHKPFVDASGTVFDTLTNNGTPSTSSNDLQDTCLATTCHGNGADVTLGFGGRTAKAAHSTINGITLGSSLAAPGDCSDCHAAHRGEEQTSLIVLLNDGSKDLQDGTAHASTEYVTPAKCGGCHDKDDTTQYSARGHGQPQMSGGFVCNVCHDETEPHLFATGASGSNPMRFSYAESTSAQTSVIRLEPVYNNAFSICMTCHSTISRVHGSSVYAGCNDCHEPHGDGVGTNAFMIRQQIPKTDSNGNPVYADGTGTAYETIVYQSNADAYRADGQGLCDNAECHAGRTVNGRDLYDLDTIMAGTHTGGVPQAAGSNCFSCHNHSDNAGSWAANESCELCHGIPPTSSQTSAPSYLSLDEQNTPHSRHYADYGIGCKACHDKWVDKPWHNSGGFDNADGTWTNQGDASYQTVYFDAALNPSADNSPVGSSPDDHAQSYNSATRECSDLYCHSDGSSTSAVNAAPVQWNDSGWGSADLACDACHAGVEASGQITTGNHPAHLGVAGIDCKSCHDASITTLGSNTTSVANPAAHVDGVKTLQAGGTFKGGTVSFSWDGSNCSNISCHGGWKTIAWNAATGSCESCHSYPPDGVGGSTNHALTSPNNIGATQLLAAHYECDTCHGISAATTGDPASGFGTPVDKIADFGDAYVIGTNHMDGLVQLNGPSAPDNNQSTYYDEANNGCNNNCHGTATPPPSWVFTSVGTNNVDLMELGTVTCSTCHIEGVTLSSASGAHADHGATSASVSNDPASVSVCSDCHGEDGTSPGGTHNDGKVDFVTGLTYSAAATRGDLTGTCSGAAACHDSASDIAWNTTQAAVNDCAACHKASADLNDYLTSKNAKASMISSTEFTGQGHGAAAQGSKNCMSCHDITVPHDFSLSGTAETNYRLKSGFSCSDGSAGCHVGAQATNELALNLTYGNIVTHEYDQMSAPKVATWSFTPKCVDCHDPHGDGNDKMIQRDLWEGSSAGWVPQNIENGALGFTDHLTGQSSGGSSYADTDTPFSSLCQECHDDAAMSSYKDGLTADQSNHPSSPTDCSGCHKHDSGFKPSGCSGCHGDPVAETYWPDGADGSPAYVDDEAGAHDTHINAIASVQGWSTTGEKNASCSWCHPSPGGVRPGVAGDSHTLDSESDQRVDVHGDGRPGATATYFKTMAGADDSATPGTYNAATGVCSNIDCHGNSDTPGWLPPPPDTAAPTWPSGEGLTVTDLVRTGFELGVSWNAASDESPPISYDLFRHTGTNACVNGSLIASDLTGTGYTDSSITDGSTYYYCVRAKAAGGTPNNADSSTVSGSATEPAPTGGSCYVGSGYDNRLSSWSSSGNSSSTTTYAQTDTPATDDCNLDTFCLWSASGSASTITIFTHSYPGSGTSTTNSGTEINLAWPSSDFSLNAWSCTPASMFISAGDYLAFYSPNGMTVARMNGGGGYLYSSGSDRSPPTTNWTGTTASNSYSLYATGTSGPVPDVTDPTFAGLSSATDAATGGTVLLSWSAGTDTGTGDSNPVVYNIWYSTTTNGYPAQGTNLASTTQTSFTVSGLTDDTPYFFLVRAEDGAGNEENNTNELSATPTGVGGGTDPTGCAVCHTWPQASGKHSSHGAITDPEVSAAQCYTCHGDVSGYTTAHGNGVVDLPLPGDLTGPDATYSGGTSGTCATVSCHFDSTTPNWSTGSTQCDSCHGYPPTSGANHTNTSPANVGASRLLGAHEDCALCHGIAAATPGDPTSGAGTPKDLTSKGGDAYVRATMHGDGLIQMNGVSIPNNGQNAGYNDAGGCADACHAESWTVPVSSKSTQLLELGSGSCSACHGPGGSGPTVVWPSGNSGITSYDYGTHLMAASTDTLDANTDWGLQCGKCHGFHGGTSNDVLIPMPTTNAMQQALGFEVTGPPNWDYNDDTGHGGIWLGGTDTLQKASNTEAEICWGCHINNGVSEFNAKGNELYNSGGGSTTPGSGAAYWSGASFDAAGTRIPTRPTASIHTADAATGTSSVANNVNGTGIISVTSLEPASAVRCSHCHDVHSTFGGSTTGDRKPWLRGKWKPNPYPLERPPQSGDTYSGNNYAWNGSPPNSPRLFRSSAGSASVGGFFIDQNSGFPNDGETLDSVGGLCTICHGTSVDSMDQYTGSKLWLPGQSNGHSNSTLGGSGTNAVNIFDARRGSTWWWMAVQDMMTTGQWGKSSNGQSQGIFFGSVGQAEDRGAGPARSTGWYSSEEGTTTFSDPSGWYTNGSIGNNTGSSGRAHDFSCSKCHTPHSSGLPALLITNCLDKGLSNWSASANSGNMGPNQSGVATTVQMNCHRKTSRTDGWNYLAPNQ